jgi:hypothetical protein
MDKNELLANIRAMVAQWRGVEALVAEGKLVPKHSGWYEVHGPGVLESVGKIADAVESSANPVKPTRVRLRKPASKWMALADEHSVK